MQVRNICPLCTLVLSRSSQCHVREHAGEELKDRCSTFTAQFCYHGDQADQISAKDVSSLHGFKANIVFNTNCRFPTKFILQAMTRNVTTQLVVNLSCFWYWTGIYLSLRKDAEITKQPHVVVAGSHWPPHAEAAGSHCHPCDLQHLQVKWSGSSWHEKTST